MTKIQYTHNILPNILITYKIINKFQNFALQCKNKWAAECNLNIPMDNQNNFNNLKNPLKLEFVLITHI